MALTLSGVAYSINPLAGVVDVIVTREIDRSQVEKSFGEKVAVAVAKDLALFSGGRYGDASPHYGDAAISPGWVPPTCTSNFSFRSNVYGTRVTASAGHCGWAYWWSGPNYLGDTVFNSASPDVQMIYGSGQSYTNQIYVDPCSPCTRTVIGKASPGVNEYVCVGGSVTLAQCGIEVINTNATFCPGTGEPCTYNMIQTFKLLNEYAGPGDSGGIVYQRSGASNALAVGMIRGGGWVFGGLTVFHTKVSTIEATLNVTLVTSP
jgi:hypothetical protein